MRPLMIGLAVALLCSASATPALAYVFRVDVPALEKACSDGQATLPVPIDLGTPLRDIVSVHVELTGTFAPGWWVGDGIEDTYVGPKNDYLVLGMPTTGSNGIDRGYNATQGGPFFTSLDFTVPDLSFLADGVTSLGVWNEIPGPGWGHFDPSPCFTLTHVELVIDATPLPEPSACALLRSGAAILAARIRQRRTQTA